MLVKRLGGLWVHGCFLALLLAVALPGRREVASPLWLCLFILLIEGVVVYQAVGGEHSRSVCDVGGIIFLILLLWEVFSTCLNVAHPILVPTPEAVFAVFPKQWQIMLQGVFASLTLLATSSIIAIPSGAVLGALAGWVPRLREAAVPVARVLAPIPAIVYAPYLIALAPTFRSASVAVLFIGIFWPVFLQTVNRVTAIDPLLLDSARALALSDSEMLFRVFLPWMLPGLLSSLRVTFSTSFMLLTLAEMMGATSGLGYYIKNYSDYANYTNVVAGIFLIGFVVTVLNSALTLVEKKTLCGGSSS